jgi:hypothetical protein
MREKPCRRPEPDEAAKGAGSRRQGEVPFNLALAVRRASGTMFTARKKVRSTAHAARVPRDREPTVGT